MKIYNRTGKTNRIFAGLSSFETIAMFRRGLFYCYLSIYLRNFLGLSVTETTLFATIPMIMNASFQTFVWGRISDKYQLRRTLIIIGEVMGGIGTIITWYLHTQPDDKRVAAYVIILGLSCIEIFWSMSNIGWSSLLSDVFPEKSRSKVQGRIASISGFGQILGVWIGGVLYNGMELQYEGWGFFEGSLFFVASFAMFISVIPMLFMPEGGISDNGGNGNGNNRNIFSMKIFLIFLAGMVFINFGRNMVSVILPQYLVLKDGFNLSSGFLSYIVNSQAVATIIAGLFAGYITTKFGVRKTLMLGAVTGALSLLIFSVTTNIAMIFTGSFLRGASDIIVISSSYTLASVLIPPERRARLFGLFNATIFLSWGLASTLIAGPITDTLIALGNTEVFSFKAAFFSGFTLIITGIFILYYLFNYIMVRNHVNVEVA
ncbi:MAG: MFS transporter [Desulfobacterales bacterium]|nr:MFS transporter [Desulfobacterales bacterium]MCP4158651.1 MFS transporter [Deltaproteobacteria bacterium]